MSVIRVQKNKNFTVMSNYHLRDKRLSYKTRGLLSTILSLPSDWDYSVKGLSTLSRDGMDSVRTGLMELEDNGYLIRERIRGPDGRMTGTVYTIFEVPRSAQETPITDNPSPENPITEDLSHNPTSDNPILDEPALEKPMKLNKEDNKELKEQRTKENNPDCLTDACEKIEKILGRKLYCQEIPYIEKWIGIKIPEDLILLAVEDNLYLNDKFNLQKVQRTLDLWRSLGIKTAREARNFILDKKAKAIKDKIQSKAHEDQIDEYITKNEILDLQGMRDYLIELYENKRYDALIATYNMQPHKDIKDYLPEDILNHPEPPTKVPIKKHPR